MIASLANATETEANVADAGSDRLHRILLSRDETSKRLSLGVGRVTQITRVSEKSSVLCIANGSSSQNVLQKLPILLLAIQEYKQGIVLLKKVLIKKKF